MKNLFAAGLLLYLFPEGEVLDERVIAITHMPIATVMYRPWQNIVYKILVTEVCLLLVLNISFANISRVSWQLILLFSR